MDFFLVVAVLVGLCVMLAVVWYVVREDDE
jgi:hypothetical protein